MAALYLVDGSGNALAAAATWGEGQPLLGFDLEGCRALRRGQVHRVVPPEDQLRCAHLAGLGGASICVPMVTNGRSYGILSLSFSVGQLDLPGVKTKEQLATVVAQRISLTLTNLRIKEQRKASIGHSRSRNP